MKSICYQSKIWMFLIAVGFVSCQKAEVTKPQKVDITDVVFASGHVISDHEYQVTANTEGYLVNSFVEEGAKVKSGMPLFHLANGVQSEQLSNAQVNYNDALAKMDVNSPERKQLELQIEQANQQLAQDRRNYERYKKLFESKAVSQVEFEKAELQYENGKRNVEIQQKSLDDLMAGLELNLKNAETQLVIQRENNNDYFLSSSIDGEVLSIFKEQGELVRRGEAVAIIGGGDRLVKLFVSEEDIHEVKPGQEVVLSLNTDKERNYEGKVTRIMPSFDELEQSFVIEAAFVDAPAVIYHNTQLQANIIIGQFLNAWVIPPQYLLEGDSVLTSANNLKFVEVGLRNENWVQIMNGLDESETLKVPKAL